MCAQTLGRFEQAGNYSESHELTTTSILCLPRMRTIKLPQKPCPNIKFSAILTWKVDQGGGSNDKKRNDGRNVKG
eukprot:2483739-Rhodomonas_salina.1